MSQSGTCVAGYNNIRFDDEFTRQLLFRNLYDPYSREWKNGNSRWDIIDVVRLTRALRPEGINWPCDENGHPTNRLEHLTQANNIAHGDAHDALADVRATIAIARLIKKKQPKLFEYALKMRRKRNVALALDLVHNKPVLHVSGMYSGRDLNLSIVAPLCQHPSNANGVLAYDLRKDPAALIELDAETVAHRLFTSADKLPANTERLAIKTIHLNRCPAIAPLSTLTEENIAKLSLDVPAAMQHRNTLLANLESVTAKLANVFAHYASAAPDDPELTLYSGSFASDHDRQLMEMAQTELTKGMIETEKFVFQDNRLNELFLRLRARNQPDTLADNELNHWKKLCNSRVHLGYEGFRSIGEFENSLAQMQSNYSDQKTTALVAALAAYGREVAAYSEANGTP